MINSGLEVRGETSETLPVVSMKVSEWLLQIDAILDARIYQWTKQRFLSLQHFFRGDIISMGMINKVNYTAQWTMSSL